MTRISILLVAPLTFAIAGAAFAADHPDETRAVHKASASACAPAPASTDEARAQAGLRIAPTSVTASPAGRSARVASSTDEARALAAERTNEPAAVARAAAPARRVEGIASSTDEARALAAERTKDSVADNAARHEEVCASCACKIGDQHARAALEPCGCHKRT